MKDEKYVENKELKYFNYSWFSDNYYPTIDITGISMTFYINTISIEKKDNIIVYPEYNVYVKFFMGKLEITKRFEYAQELENKISNENTAYQPTKAKEFIDLVSKVDLRKLKTGSNVFTNLTKTVETDGYDKTQISFSYDNQENSKIYISHPDNKELLRLCNDFFYKYLMQDKEIIKILENYVEQHSDNEKELLEKNSKILEILKYDNKNIELDLSLKNYKLIDESVEVESNDSTNIENSNDSNKQEMIDDLLKKIDQRIDELERLGEQE